MPYTIQGVPYARILILPRQASIDTYLIPMEDDRAPDVQLATCVLLLLPGGSCYDPSQPRPKHPLPIPLPHGISNLHHRKALDIQNRSTVSKVYELATFRLKHTPDSWYSVRNRKN